MPRAPTSKGSKSKNAGASCTHWSKMTNDHCNVHSRWCKVGCRNLFAAFDLLHRGFLTKTLLQRTPASGQVKPLTTLTTLHVRMHTKCSSQYAVHIIISLTRTYTVPGRSGCLHYFLPASTVALLWRWGTTGKLIVVVYEWSLKIFITVQLPIRDPLRYIGTTSLQYHNLPIIANRVLNYLASQLGTAFMQGTKYFDHKVSLVRRLHCVIHRH